MDAADEANYALGGLDHSSLGPEARPSMTGSPRNLHATHSVRNLRLQSSGLSVPADGFAVASPLPGIATWGIGSGQRWQYRCNRPATLYRVISPCLPGQSLPGRL